jgi:hypothetical protein
VNVFKTVGKSFAGFAGRTGRLFGQEGGSSIAGYELGGVDVLGGQTFRGFEKEPFYREPEAPSSGVFDIGQLLRLRTFVYLIIITALFLFQIHNTLAINDLAKRNERLREQLRISTSITTAQELRSRELQSIRYISGYARNLDLDSSFIPPVELEP